MLQSILSNLAIILLTHLIMSMFVHYRKRLTPFLFDLIIILLVTGSVVSMFYLPIRIGDFSFDMRFIPLIFYAYFHGWKIALPALALSSLWRLALGGEGAVPGIIFGMIGPTILALTFHKRAKIKGNYIEKIALIIACWLICDIPIIFLVPQGLEVFKEIAFIRCLSFVVTSLIWYIFMQQNRHRQYLLDKLEKLAGEDPLTKLLNKRKFFEIVEKKMQLYKPQHYIAMVDIDHFKPINDTYGHLVGDQILIEFSKILMKYDSSEVKVARYGGEEFIIYIGNSNDQAAKQLVETIFEDIKTHRFHIDQSKYIRITASIGLALIEKDVHEAVNRADINLYKAKERGRNCLVCS